MQTTLREWVAAALEQRLSVAGREFLAKARAEVAARCEDARFAELLSLTSRFVSATPLAPGAEELAAAERLLPGWNPERWTLREAARIDLLLTLPDAANARGERAVESAFAFADAGELCALYRGVALLPEPQRFFARVAEGARSNIRAVFEAAICDSPFPARHFDDVAWRQCVIKALFIEAPLWRVQGLDSRLDAELARMALDLCEERRSAGRHVNPQLWMCLGVHGGERGRRALLAELAAGTSEGRAAAALALGRLSPAERAQLDFAALLAQQSDPRTRAALTRARGGDVAQHEFKPYDGPVPKVV